MYKKNRIFKAVKFALVASVGMTAMPSTIQAAEIQANEEVERIEVTGSRIKRSEFESASPISVFNSKEILSSGVTSVDEFLQTIPAFTGYQQTASTNNGSDGQKKVDLRGLDFNRTLVLINGRRQIGDVNDDGAVDINAVPIGMVKRIEVLKDGASTIYGADAIAGVVNIILKTDFEGIEFSVNAGAGTKDGQAENKGFSVLMGTTAGKASFTMGLEYSKQKEMKQDERPWATEALYPQMQSDGSFKAIGAGSSNSRKITIFDADDIAAAGGAQFIVDETTGEVRPFNSATDTYNYAPVNALITPNERFQFASTGKFEYMDDQQLYMETMYTRRTSHQRLAPDASFQVDDEMQLVPASNPFNPFGNSADNEWGIEGKDVRINRRFVESGGRLYAQSADTFRMVLGASGYFNEDLNYDISFTYAENEFTQETKYLHRMDKWQTMVDPDLCAADAACLAAVGDKGVLNPFSPYGGISDAEIDYLMAKSLKSQSWGRMMGLQAVLSGDLEAVDFGSGSLGWAAGFEHRTEKGEFKPDEFLGEGLTTGGANDPQSGQFTVDEVYAEFNLPLTDDLTLDASVRYSDYDTVGDTTNFKIGADYVLSDWAKFRSGYATGFRAPNISEINQKETTNNPVVEPYCEFSDIRSDITDTIRSNCQALVGSGDSSTELGFAYQGSVVEKAPDGLKLKPEESTTFTFGTILTPVENLNISVDYWAIEVDNYIDIPNYNDLSYNCLNSEGLSAPSCAVFNDWAGGKEPVALPGTGLAYPSDATVEFGNLGKIETNGIDFDVQYTFDTGFMETSLDLRWSATHTLSRETTFALVGSRETVGTADGNYTYPEWRMNSSANLTANDWSLQYALRFIGETTDAYRPENISDDVIAESVVYHDISASYNIGKVSIGLGVSNLTDVDAPRFHSAFNANTAPGVYDVIGRRLFGSVSVKF